MLVGSFGGITFVVARGYVRTFDDFSRDTTARWAKHDIIGRKPVVEYLGPDVQKVSFKMTFRADHGMNPTTEAKRLREMLENGTHKPLIIGGKPVSQNDWVIESLGESVTHWSAFGVALIVTVDVRLSEYVDYMEEAQ